MNAGIGNLGVSQEKCNIFIIQNIDNLVTQLISWSSYIQETDKIFNACSKSRYNMEDRRSAYRNSVRKSQKKRAPGKPRRRWEDNIGMHVK